MTHRIAMLSLAILASLSGAACSYARVGSGEVAVVRTPDGIDPKVYPTGDWHIGIWDQPTAYSTRSQERAEQLEVLASNGLRIVLDASIRYHIVPEEAVALDHELGVNYYEVLLGPTLRSQSRRVIGRYQPEEIYSTQRELIERQIREGVESAIKGRHVVLEAVLIRNVRLPETIQMAINNKLEAEQQALKMKYVIDQAKAEAERKLMETKAEAERSRIEAEGRAAAEKIAEQGIADAKRTEAQAAADAKRMDGQATAEYQAAVQKGLTEAFLKWQQIEATKALGASPSSKLIFLGGATGATPILDMRGVQAATIGGP